MTPKQIRIVAAVRHLGRRHVDYGVRPQHYDTVGDALMWTLAQGLGDEFTDEVEAAWVAAYDLLANMMKGAAAEAELIVHSNSLAKVDVKV